MKTLVLIPSFEPTDKLIELVKELKNNKLEIIVVNDGSDIKYNEIFNKINSLVTLINHNVNKGKGSALKTGFNYIKKNLKEDYIIITMDCDGQHKVHDALKLRDYVLNNPFDLALGKRKRNNKTPFRSKFGNSLTRFFFKTSTKVDIYDTQTGLRAFSNKLLDFMINIHGERFEYEMNVLLKCAHEKINIKEIEIETIYFDNNSKSHFKAIKDSILVISQILKFSKK